MQKRLSKYKIGDKVVISQFFKNIPHGHMVKGEPIVCEVKDLVFTSMGPNYKLHNENIELQICYWEEDIDHKIEEECKQ